VRTPRGDRAAPGSVPVSRLAGWRRLAGYSCSTTALKALKTRSLLQRSLSAGPAAWYRC